MITRSHGYRYEDFRSTTVNLFPPRAVYADGDHTDNSERTDRILAWAWRWADRCKEQFPYCRLQVDARIHRGGRYDYVEIEIFSANGSHTEAAEWLEYATRE